MASKMVTVRLLDEEIDEYKLFKDNVCNKMHSDVCFVTGQLWKAFNRSFMQIPNLDMEEPISIQTFKQNVQINMGCTFQYYTKKARRTPQDETSIISDRDNFIPKFTDQYPTMRKQAQDFWIEELKAQGWKMEAPATVSAGKPKAKRFQKLKRLWSIVKQIKSRLFQ